MCKTFCGCSLAFTNTRPGGLIFMWFYVLEHLKAQLAVVLIKKTSQKTGPQLKVSSDILVEPGIELGTLGTAPPQS